jgi:DNA-binding transcriptional MerR regulator
VVNPIYTLPELAAEAGIEYRTAHVWQRRGLIKASIKEPNGTGHASLYSAEDVKVARELKTLRDLGVGPDGLEQVLRDPSPLLTALEPFTTPSGRR